MNVIKEEKSVQKKSIWFKNANDEFVEYKFNYSKNYDELVRYFKNPKKNKKLEAKVLKTLNYVKKQMLAKTRDKDKIKNKTITDNMLNKLYDDTLNKIPDNKNIINLEKSSKENLKSFIIEYCIYGDKDFYDIVSDPNNPRALIRKEIPISNNDKNNKKIIKLIKENIKTVNFIISSFNITVSSQIFKKIKKIKIEKNKDNLYELEINVVDNQDIDRTFLFDEDNIAGNVMTPITISNRFSQSIQQEIFLYEPFTTKTSNKKQINIREWFRLLDNHVRKINKKLLKDKNKTKNTADLFTKAFNRTSKILINSFKTIKNKNNEILKVNQNDINVLFVNYRNVVNELKNSTIEKLVTNKLETYIKNYVNNVDHLLGFIDDLYKEKPVIEDYNINIKNNNFVIYVKFKNLNKALKKELLEKEMISPNKDFERTNTFKVMKKEFNNQEKNFEKNKVISTSNKKKKIKDYRDLDVKVFKELDEIIENKIKEKKKKNNNFNLFFTYGLSRFILKYHYVKNNIKNISYYKNNIIDLYLNNISYCDDVLKKLETSNREIKDAKLEVSEVSGIYARVVFWNDNKSNPNKIITYKLKPYENILTKNIKNSKEFEELIQKIKDDVKKYPFPEFLKKPSWEKNDEEEDNDDVEVKKVEDKLKDAKNSVDMD